MECCLVLRYGCILNCSCDDVRHSTNVLCMCGAVLSIKINEMLVFYRKRKKLYRNFLSLYDCLLNKLFPICTFNLNIFLSPLILLQFDSKLFVFVHLKTFSGFYLNSKHRRIICLSKF